MKKFIVTTSIYEPSEATIKFSEMKDWTLIVVGDKKTPHKSYNNINCIYLSPDYQEQRYKELSDAIGWNCIQRRNIGFIEAYRLGANIIASVDDDNIPYPSWGRDILVGSEWLVDTYKNSHGIFDPLQATNHKELWHRGYPFTYKKDSVTSFIGMKRMKVLIQADLWDGDPDVDAVCRMLLHPRNIRLETPDFYTSNDYTPFNSQNTFIAREAIPYYMVLPGIGRMDDIWGGYICEHLLNIRPVFGKPTVFQSRNEQSLKKNFEDEVLGYTSTLEFITHIGNWRNILPESTLKAFDLYRKAYELPSV